MDPENRQLCGGGQGRQGSAAIHEIPERKSGHPRKARGLHSLGVDPTEALKALLASVKDAIGGAVSAVSQPMHLKEAVRLYVASLPALWKNRGHHGMGKTKVFDQLAEHLQAAGHDVEKIRVHEILRPLILDLSPTYAARKSKEEKRNEKADSEGVARAQQGLDDLKNDVRGTSSRTILKKVGNVERFLYLLLAGEVG